MPYTESSAAKDDARRDVFGSQEVRLPRPSLSGATTFVPHYCRLEAARNVPANSLCADPSWSTNRVVAAGPVFLMQKSETGSFRPDAVQDKS